jgi:hypothetical protein
MWEKEQLKWTFGGSVVCLSYCLQSQHMAHTIPIDVWAIPLMPT